MERKEIQVLVRTRRQAHQEKDQQVARSVFFDNLFSFREVITVEPVVFPCKVGRNLSVRASVICRGARSVPCVELKVAEVGPLLESQVVRWIVTKIMSWQRFAELVAKNRPSRRSVLDILRMLSQFSRDVWDFQPGDDRESVHPPPFPLEFRPKVSTTCRRFLGCYLAALDAGRSHTYIYESALLVNIRTASDCPNIWQRRRRRR